MSSLQFTFEHEADNVATSPNVYSDEPDDFATSSKAYSKDKKVKVCNRWAISIFGDGGDDDDYDDYVPEGRSPRGNFRERRSTTLCTRHRQPLWLELVGAHGPLLTRLCCYGDGPSSMAELANEEKNGVCCVFFDSNGLLFATRQYERLTEIRSGTQIKTKAFNLPWFSVCYERPDVQLKRVGWQRLGQLHLDVLGVPLDTKLKDLRPSGSREGVIVVAILAEQREGEKPFWLLVHAFGTVLNDTPLVVWLLTPLEAAVPAALVEWLHSGDLGSAVTTSQDTMNQRRCSVWLDAILYKLLELCEGHPSDAPLEDLVLVVENFCELIFDAFNIEDAFAGDHLVPKVGQVAPHLYRHLENVEAEITRDWQKSDCRFGPVSRIETNTLEPAWTLADPGALDCALIFMSRGFEDMTGYWRAYGLGRNCRFVQPKDQARNAGYNGSELPKIAEFCKQKEGHLVSFLMAERNSGVPIWQILFLKHIQRPGPGGGPLTRYIFALHTDLYIQREAINELLPKDPTEASIAALKEFRAILQDKLRDFSFVAQSIQSLGDEVTTEWLLNTGHDCRCCYVDASFAPRVGLAAARAFHLANNLQRVLAAASPHLAIPANFCPDMLGKCVRDEADGLPFSVQDPLAKDDPLVYVSKSWQEVYGYSAAAAVSRNSRFLQPGITRLNSVINGEEVSRIRSFCEEIKPPGSAACTLLSFLLHERSTGDRVWTFLYSVQVALGQLRYIVAFHFPMEMQMPGVLLSREQSKWYDDEMGRTADEWGAYIARLRDLIRGRDHIGSNSGGIREVAKFACEHISGHMKTCEDYEGDHFVAKIGLKEVMHFKENITWQGVYAVVREDVRRLTDNAHWDGSDLAYCVSDPSGSECPLVYVSRGFEELTGYHAEFALGRNCRFVQPKRSALNKRFNEAELKRLSYFTKVASNSSDGRPTGELPQKRIMSLLVNSHKERFPFWNLLWMERVEVCGRPYIFGAQTHIDAGGRLVELLAGDDAGMEQLDKLRKLFRKRESCLGCENLRTVITRCLDEWMRYYPPVLELPRIPCQGMPWPFPLVGLEVSVRNASMDLLVDAMETGIRHFHITFPVYNEVKDNLRHEFEGRLMALRLAELLNRLATHHLKYLKAGMVLSVRTPPYLVRAFAEIRKAVTSNGEQVACWLLDARHATAREVAQSWQAMSAAKNAGEVRVIGMYGGGHAAVAAARNLPGGARLAVYAGEMLPGSRVSTDELELHGQIQASNGIIMAANIFGHGHSWLLSDRVQLEAEKLGVDPAIMLLKWVEHQGYAALVPSLGLEKQTECQRQSVRPRNGQSANGADGTVSVVEGSMTSMWTRKNWGPNPPQDLNSTRAEEAKHPTIHRGFVRAYRSAPSAEICSVATNGDSTLSPTMVQRRRTFELTWTDWNCEKSTSAMPAVAVEKSSNPDCGTTRALNTLLQDPAEDGDPSMSDLLADVVVNIAQYGGQKKRTKGERPVKKIMAIRTLPTVTAAARQHQQVELDEHFDENGEYLGGVPQMTTNINPDTKRVPPPKPRGRPNTSSHWRKMTARAKVATGEGVIQNLVPSRLIAHSFDTIGLNQKSMWQAVAQIEMPARHGSAIFHAIPNSGFAGQAPRCRKRLSGIVHHNLGSAG